MQRPQSTQSTNITHVIFDFDFTISREHIHYFLNNAMINGQFSFSRRLKFYERENWSPAELEEMWQWIVKQNKQFSTGDAIDWRAIFVTLIDHHIEVAIASFSSFGPILQRFLAETIQLPPDYLKKIHIESWLPNPKGDNKNNHIDRILLNIPSSEPIAKKPLLSQDERRLHFASIILVEDSAFNIAGVKDLASDQNVLHVPPHDNTNPVRVIHALKQRLGITIVPAADEISRLESPSRRP